jgi:uncharacterized protein YigA (DUF484 family)
VSEENGNNKDDRRERQMEFILEQQAQFTVDIQLLKEQTREQKIIVDGLLDLQNTLTATVMQIANGAVQRFDKQSAEMTVMHERHDRQDAQIAATNESIKELTRTVERYITARGQNSNGTNGQA